MSFAAKLAQHRQRLGLTQAGAAALLDVGLRTYATWERDDDPKRRPHVLTQEGVLARLEKLRPPVRLWRGKAGRNRRADGP
jgi:DNA-binding XRE family transcriptional regulator